jgi:hypothetical protein
MKRHFSIIAALILAAGFTGCTTTTGQNGGVVGGLMGAGLGAIIGHQSGDAGEGALIGAAAGAIAGGLAGDAIHKNRYTRTHEVRYVQTPPPPPPPPTRSPGHWESRVVRSPSGELYEERVWIPRR